MNSQPARLSTLAQPCVMFPTLTSSSTTTVPGALRWGEALHPGPADGELVALDGLLNISFTNPSGLRNKEQVALSIPEGIINFSETQLSLQTQKSCAARLKFLGSQQHRNLRVHLGTPVPVRTTSSWAGTWSGVATISDLASQEVALPYSGERDCGRVLTTCHYLGNFHLLNVVVFGFPAGPSWPQHKSLTSTLLEIVTTEIILGAKGPRIVGGDMNVSPDQLPLFDYWHSHGWCSAQDFAYNMWGQPKEFTCKHSTERDLAWLSPEAQALCRAVCVRDHFMEHSTLAVGLQVPTMVQPLLQWPKPSQLPYDELDPRWTSALPPVWDDTCAVDDQWAQLGASYERCFAGFVPSQPNNNLTRNQKGRLQRTKPVKRLCQTSVLRASRPSEVAMRNGLLGQEVHFWSKQLRRLQSYYHGVRANKQTASALAYRLENFGLPSFKPVASRLTLPPGGRPNLTCIKMDFASYLLRLLALPLQSACFTTSGRPMRSLSLGTCGNGASSSERNMNVA